MQVISRRSSVSQKRSSIISTAASSTPGTPSLLPRFASVQHVISDELNRTVADRMGMSHLLLRAASLDNDEHLLEEEEKDGAESQHSNDARQHAAAVTVSEGSAAMRQQLMRLQTELNTRVAECQVHQRLAHQLEAIVRPTELELQHTTSKYQTLTTDYQTLHTSYGLLQEASAELEASVEREQYHVRDLLLKLQNREEQISLLTVACTEADQKSAAARLESATSRQELDARLQQAAIKQQQMSEHHAANELQLQSEIAQRTEEARQAQADTLQQQQANEELTRQLDQMTHQQNDLQISLSELIAKSTAADAAHTQQVAQLTTALSGSQQELQQRNARCDQLKQEKQHSITLLQEQEQLLLAFQQQIAVKEAEFVAQVAELREQAQHMQEQHDMKMHTLQQQHAKAVDHLEQQVDSRESEVQLFRTRVFESEQQLRMEQQQNIQQQQQIERLTQQVDELSAEYTPIELQIDVHPTIRVDRSGQPLNSARASARGSFVWTSQLAEGRLHERAAAANVTVVPMLPTHAAGAAPISNDAVLRYEATISSLQSKVIQLLQHRSELEAQLQPHLSSMQEVVRLRAELQQSEHVRQQLMDAEQELEIVQQEYRKVQHAHRDTQQQQQDDDQHWRSVQELNDKLLAEKSELEQVLGMQVIRADELQAELNERQAQAQALQSQEEDIQSEQQHQQLQAANEQLLAAHAANDDLRQQLAALQAEMAAKVAQLMQSLQQMTQEVVKSDALMSDKNAELTLVTAQVNELQLALSAATSDNASAAEMEALQQQYSELQLEHQQCSPQHELQLQLMEQELDSKSATIDEQMETMTSLSDQVETLEQQVADLQATISSYEVEVAEGQRQVQQLLQEKEELEVAFVEHVEAAEDESAHVAVVEVHSVTEHSLFSPVQQPAMSVKSLNAQRVILLSTQKKQLQMELLRIKQQLTSGHFPANLASTMPLQMQPNGSFQSPQIELEADDQLVSTETAVKSIAYQQQLVPSTPLLPMALSFPSTPATASLQSPPLRALAAASERDLQSAVNHLKHAIGGNTPLAALPAKPAQRAPVSVTAAAASSSAHDESFSQDLRQSSKTLAESVQELQQQVKEDMDLSIRADAQADSADEPEVEQENQAVAENQPLVAAAAGSSKSARSRIMLPPTSALKKKQGSATPASAALREKQASQSHSSSSRSSWLR